MQPYRISLTILVTLLATVSTPLTIYSAAAFLATQPSVLVQNTRKAQADKLLQQGIEQYQKGQHEAAIESWQQSLSIYQEIQDRQGEGTALKNIGATYIVVGNYPKAIEFLEPFLSIAQANGDRKGEAQALGNLGIAYKQSGNYNKAIQSHQKALTLMRELKDRQGEGQVLANLGNTYEALGDYEQAIASYEQSLTIAREINNRLREGVALGNLGAIYGKMGDYDKAIENYKQSLNVAQTIGDKEGEASNLNNLGVAYHVQKDLTQAIEYYTQGLTIARTIGDRQREGEVLVNLGIAYEDQRNFAKAIESHQQGLSLAQAMGDRKLEGVAFNNLGHALFNSGKLVEAEKNLREAVKVLESLRPGLDDANKVSIFDTQVLTYNLLQQILIAQEKFDAALEIAEQGRARAFVELLAQRISPETAINSTANSQPPTIEQIKKIAKAQNSTLVEYLIVPDEEFKVQGKLRGTESELFIWVVKPTGEVAFRRVDLKFLQQQQGEEQGRARQAEGTASTAFEKLVKTSRIVRSPGLSRGEEARKQLHKLLIEPIAEYLPTDPQARVTFIPHESLFLVPFPALQDASEQYLIEKHTILVAPAIQVLDLTHQQQQRLEQQHSEPIQGKDVLVVGNPTMPFLNDGDTTSQLAPLPSAEQEAHAIAQLLDTKAIIGDKATKEHVVQQMSQARLVHLATHGLLDDIKELGVPGAIALAPSNKDDGFLTAGEILDLKLNAELVVLSACNTGQGKITGDGVIGLSRSLITSGVPSTLVSLWAVPDSPTALLMTDFYRNIQENPDKAQALRQAMLTTMKEHPAPYNWAAFTLIGEAE